MQILMLVSSPDAETRWNAFRFANLMLERGDDVTIFLNGPAVDYAAGDSDALPIAVNAKTFALSEGILLA